MAIPLKRIIHTRKIYLVSSAQKGKNTIAAQTFAHRFSLEYGHNLSSSNAETPYGFSLSDYSGNNAKNRMEKLILDVKQELQNSDERPIVVAAAPNLQKALHELADQHGISVEKVKLNRPNDAVEAAKSAVEKDSVKTLSKQEIDRLFENAELEGLPGRALHHVLDFLHRRFHIDSSSFMMRQPPFESELRERMERSKTRLYSTAHFHSIIEEKPPHLDVQTHQTMLDAQKRVEVDLTKGKKSDRLTAKVITGHEEEQVDTDGHYFTTQYHQVQHNPEIDLRLGNRNGAVRSVFMAPLFNMPETERRKFVNKYVPHGNMAIFRLDCLRALPKSVVSEIKRVLHFGRKEGPPETTTKLDRTMRALWQINDDNLTRHQESIGEIHDLEQEDEYTAGHTLRVAALTRLFGRYAYRELASMKNRKMRELKNQGMNSEDIQKEQFLTHSAQTFLSQHAGHNPLQLFDRLGIIQMYYAGLLHDVGKRRKGIPDELQVPLKVLQKPGQLHYGEFSQMRRHPLAAAFALKDLPLNHPILLAAMQHHGDWDGKRSYPSWYNPKTKRLIKLKGSAIHPYAQFVALADVMDALVSKRPYRKKMPDGTYLDQYSLERTVGELMKMKGKFAPFVRQVLRRMIKDPNGFSEIHEIYQASKMDPPLQMSKKDESSYKNPGNVVSSEQISHEQQVQIAKQEKQLTLNAWKQLHQERKVADIAG